jgi:hypothetical protein
VSPFPIEENMSFQDGSGKFLLRWIRRLIVLDEIGVV